MKRKVLAIFLIVCMLTAVLSQAVWADNNGGDPTVGAGPNDPSPSPGPNDPSPSPSAPSDPSAPPSPSAPSNPSPNDPSAPPDPSAPSDPSAPPASGDTAGTAGRAQNFEVGVGWQHPGVEVIPAGPGDWDGWDTLPEYGQELYGALVWGSSDQNEDGILFADLPMQLPEWDDPAVPDQDVISVEESALTERDYFAGGGLSTLSDTLLQDSLSTMTPGSAEQSINYAQLREGDVVRTTNFNGIYVTSVVKSGNAAYDTAISEAKSGIVESFHAFDRDHPEVFWLSGQMKMRIITATVGSQQTSYLFFVLADNKGFTLRDASYPSSAEINAAVQLRDQAVSAILAQVPTSGVYEQIVALNRWFTTHNEYNRSADLGSIGTAPHRCMSALTGNTGTNGPVCDGYSRAFKVLCDRLGIPCVLVTGYASSGAEHTGEYHMWNSVRMPDGNWYGADITWDDPIVPGKNGAVSGLEGEEYLLVGGSTVIRGVPFEHSHQPMVQLTSDAAFDVPVLNPVAYSAGAPVAPALPFSDVPADAYYYDAVVWALAQNVTTGTSATTFSPANPCTRAQVVTFLWRAVGSPEPSSSKNPFTDVPADTWYSKAVLWAVEKGVTAGTSETTFSPTNPCTYAHILTFLYRALGITKTAGSYQKVLGAGTWYSDSLTWAVYEGLIPAEVSTADPVGMAASHCPRRDVVYFLWRALAE